MIDHNRIEAYNLVSAGVMMLAAACMVKAASGLRTPAQLLLISGGTCISLGILKRAYSLGL